MKTWQGEFKNTADAILAQQGIEAADLGLTTEEYASQIASWGLANNYDVGDPETQTHLNQIATRALRQKIADRNNDKKRDTHLDVYMDYEVLKSVTGASKANVWTINPEAKPEDQKTVNGAVVNDIMGDLKIASYRENKTSNAIMSELITEWEGMDEAERKKVGSPSKGENRFALWAKKKLMERNKNNTGG